VKCCEHFKLRDTGSWATESSILGIKLLWNDWYTDTRTDILKVYCQWHRMSVNLWNSTLEYQHIQFYKHTLHLSTRYTIWPVEVALKAQYCRSATKTRSLSKNHALLDVSSPILFARLGRVSTLVQAYKMMMLLQARGAKIGTRKSQLTVEKVEW